MGSVDRAGLTYADRLSVSKAEVVKKKESAEKQRMALESEKQMKLQTKTKDSTGRLGKEGFQWDSCKA